MVNMSTTFTTLANADTRDIYTKIIATVSGTNYTITGSDSICELTVEESTASDNIQLGATCSSVLKAKLRNISFTIPNATLKPYVSFDNSEWCPLGAFNVADVVEKNGEYEITAYDKIAFLTDKYTPTTGTTFAQMITAMGLELETGQTVPSYSITTAYDGTERDYLGWIAGYMGRNARMNRNGKLEFVWYQEHSVKYGDVNTDGLINSTDTAYINGNLLGKYTDGTQSGVLGIMEVGTAHVGGAYTTIGQADVNDDGIINSSDVNEITAYINGTPYAGTKVGTTFMGQTVNEDLIYVDGYVKSTKNAQTITALVSGYGENPLEVGSGRTINFANPYMTQAQLQSIWNDIITSNGFSWQPCTIELFGNPAYEVGDILTVVQGQSQYKAPIMHQKFEIKGGLKVSVTSFGQSDEEAIVDVGGIQEYVDRNSTEFKQEVERITNELNNAEGVYGGTYEKIYQTIGGNSRPTGFKIIDITDDDKYWQFDYNGLRYTNDDGTSYKVGISNSGSILADNIVSGAVLSNQITASNLTITGGGIDMTTNSESYKPIKLKWVGTSHTYDAIMSAGGVSFDNGSWKSIVESDRIGLYKLISGSYVYQGGIYVNSVSDEVGFLASYVGANTIDASLIYLNDSSLRDIFQPKGDYAELMSSPEFSTVYASYLGSSSDRIMRMYATSIDLAPESTATNTNVGYTNSTSTSGFFIQRGSGSSQRHKHDIHSLDEEWLEKIHGLYDLEVKAWTYNNDHVSQYDEYYDREIFGVIAEELEEVIPEVTFHENGLVSDYDNRRMINAMLVLIQEQNERIKVLENERTTETN